MPAGLRKLALFVHVSVSAGFPGAVACFMALAILGLMTGDHALYAAMDFFTWLIILPLCILSLITGIVSSLGTPWGVFRYYWVVVKLLLTAISTAILIVHLQPIGEMARHAAPATMPKTQIQLVAASGLALVVLLLMTALSIYKPRGLTPYGERVLAD